MKKQKEETRKAWKGSGETATEDIKEVNVLIKNFKRNDFTEELSNKMLDKAGMIASGKFNTFEKSIG